jgi:uncharacterized RDD family membrane protein YckC
MSTFERRGFSDQLNIDTPEQVELHFSIAGIGSRFVAVLLDHLIQWLALVVIFIVLALIAAAASTGASAAASRLTGGDDLNTAGKWALALIIFILFCLNWGYFALFEAFWHGQTPGKRVMKLRVIKDSGRQVTLFEALARNLLRYVDYLPGLYLTGVITMLCNKRNKRLGDFAAGTLVVHEQREEQPLMYTGSGILTQTQFTYEPHFARSGTPALFAADAIARLRPADLGVIDAFFARALDLSVEVRAAMALRIAEQMAARMGVPLPELNPERALESIALAMRSSSRA